MPDIPDPAMLDRLRDEIASRLPEFLEDLESLVNIESGSFTKAGVDEVETWMADRLEALGATITRHHNQDLGDTVVATFDGPSAGATVMLIGHTDTVFDVGTLAERPYEVRDGNIMGPGASDMKSGLLVGLYALAALRALGPADRDWLPVGKLIYVVNPDEEIGSPLSEPIIAELAQGADAAFVLEGARANGDIVSARKGMMHLRATIVGRAAHAGVEPENGRSAVLEAAHKTLALHALNGRWDGVSVNVGAINGGTRPNIVAGSAVMSIDMRAATRAAQDDAEAAIVAILEASTVPDIETTVEITALHRPMEKTVESTKLVDRAVAIASELGFTLEDTSTGGGSDANTTAGAGVPSIDGLGPVGGNDHTPIEYIELDSIVPRTTLLAALIASTGQSRE
jgi:glutamate carboxypeptidase